jgi:calmodulin
MQIFMLVDADGSGSISAHEVKHLMNLLGETIDLAEVDAMISEFDLDHSGEVDLTEFICVMATQRKALADFNKKDMLRAFNLFAKKTNSRTGIIHKVALQTALQQYGSSVASAREIVKLVDSLPVCEGSDGDFDYAKHIQTFVG